MTAEIYALCCPDTGEVRYIGKANNSAKRLKSHIRDARRRDTPVYRWVRKLGTAGKEPALRVLCVSDDWPTDERAQIAAYRASGARLLNVAEGGDEPHCSLEVRKANAHKLNARIATDPNFARVWMIKRQLADALRRGLLSETAKANMREAARRAPHIFGIWAAI